MFLLTLGFLFLGFGESGGKIIGIFLILWELDNFKRR